MHKNMGHYVEIVASTETYVDGKKLGYIDPSTYQNEDDIVVHRIPYTKWLPARIAHKLRFYPKLYELVDTIRPDFIFLHDAQFASLSKIIKYVKKHPSVRLVADSHTDYYNSARSFASRYILHGIIYKQIIRKAEPYIEKFYGVLPIRVDFLKNVYHLPTEKIDFLPMGVDDDIAEIHGNEITRKKIRNQYGITADDFLIVTGGKIDKGKMQVLKLMQAINNLSSPNIKMLFFGSVVDELRERFDSLCSDKVVYLGWATVSESYEYFSAADLVVFPSSHSVYWEQAAGLGIPLVVKYWEGITHVDLGGNVMFLYKDSEEEIRNTIEQIVTNKEEYNKMKMIAEEKGREFFSYRNIAKRCLS